jgi:hypothetical protein
MKTGAPAQACKCVTISLDSEKDDGSELGNEFYTAVAF